jgi:hypothetical protein
VVGLTLSRGEGGIVRLKPDLHDAFTPTRSGRDSEFGLSERGAGEGAFAKRCPTPPAAAALLRDMERKRKRKKRRERKSTEGREEMERRRLAQLVENLPPAAAPFAKVIKDMLAGSTGISPRASPVD